jgi:hypothetical protein
VRNADAERHIQTARYDSVTAGQTIEAGWNEY